MSKNNARKYVFGSRSGHVSNFGSAVTHCDGRSRNHRNYISRRADCFESVGDDRRITDVKCEVVKNHIVGASSLLSPIVTIGKCDVNSVPSMVCVNFRKLFVCCVL